MRIKNGEIYRIAGESARLTGEIATGAPLERPEREFATWRRFPPVP